MSRVVGARGRALLKWCGTKWRVKEQWQAGEASSMLNVKWRGREEGGGRPGEASSTLDIVMWQSRGCRQTRGGILDAQHQVTWQREGQEQTRRGVLDAWCQVIWQSGGWGQWEARPASMRCWGVFPNPAHIFWGVMEVGDEGKWLDLEEIEQFEPE